MKPTKMRPDGLLEVDHQSLRAIERIAREILTQCGYLRKNASHGDEDRLRFGTLDNLAQVIKLHSARAIKRYFKIRGW